MKFTVEPGRLFRLALWPKIISSISECADEKSTLDKRKLPLQSARTSMENYGRMMRVVKGVGSWK
jgi:hypothetical protein